MQRRKDLQLCSKRKKNKLKLIVNFKKSINLTLYGDIMAKFKIEYNKEACIGCGACTSQSSNWELVEEDGANKAKPKVTELEEVGDNKEAEEVCPVDAIKVVEA
jgi:ferredoxin